MALNLMKNLLIIYLHIKTLIDNTSEKFYQYKKNSQTVKNIHSLIKQKIV